MDYHSPPECVRRGFSRRLWSYPRPVHRLAFKKTGCAWARLRREKCAELPDLLDALGIVGRLHSDLWVMSGLSVGRPLGSFRLLAFLRDQGSNRCEQWGGLQVPTDHPVLWLNTHGKAGFTPRFCRIRSRTDATRDRT
jgi:hypothetical protein